MADRTFEGLITLTSRLAGSGFAQAQKQLRGLDATAQRMNASVNRISTGFGNMGDSLARLSAISAGVSIPAFIGMKSAVDQVATLEKSYANIAAFSGEGTENIRRLQEQGRLLARTSAATATQIAQAQFELSKSGWSADDIMKGLPGLLKGSVAMDLDVAFFGDKMTDVMAGFGIGAEQLESTMGLFAAAVGSSAMNGAQFFEAMQQAGPAAQIAGVSVETATAILAGFADAGIMGSQAGTAFKSALIKLTAPTDALRKRLSALGIEVDNYRQSISSIETGKVSTILENAGIEGAEEIRADIRKTLLDDTMSVQQRVDLAVDMATSGKDVGDATRQMLDTQFKGAIETASGNIDPLKLIDGIREAYEATGQVDAELMREVFGLETIAQGQKFLDQLDDLKAREIAIQKKAAGFLGKVYDANLDTIISARSRMASAFKEFFSTIGGMDGENFKNAFDGIAETINTISDRLRQNPEAARGALKALGALAATAPALMALSVASTGLGVALKPLGWLSSLTLLPVAAGARGAAAAFGSMAAAMPTGRRVKNLSKAIKSLSITSLATSSAVGVLSVAMRGLGAAMSFMKLGALGIGLGAVGVAATALFRNFDKLSGIIGTGLKEATYDALVAFDKFTSGDFSGAWISLKNAFTDLSAAGQLFAINFGEAWTAQLDSLEATFPALKRFREVAGNTFNIVKDAVAGLFGGDGDGQSAWQWISDAARSAGNSILDIFSDTFSQFNTSWANWINGMKSGQQSWTGIFNVLKETAVAAISSIWDAFKASPIAGWLKDVFGEERFQRYTDTLERFGNAVSGLWTSIFGSTAEGAEKAPSKLGEALTSLANAAAGLALDAAIKAVELLASAIEQLTAANNAFDKARGDGKGIFGASFAAMGELGGAGWAAAILAGIWSINKAWKAVKATVALVTAAIGGIRTKAMGVKNRVTAVGTAVTGIGNKARAAGRKVEGLNNKFKNLRTTIAGINGMGVLGGAANDNDGKRKGGGIKGAGKAAGRVAGAAALAGLGIASGPVGWGLIAAPIAYSMAWEFFPETMAAAEQAIADGFSDMLAAMKGIGERIASWFSGFSAPGTDKRFAGVNGEYDNRGRWKPFKDEETQKNIEQLRQEDPDRAVEVQKRIDGKTTIEKVSETTEKVVEKIHGVTGTQGARNKFTYYPDVKFYPSTVDQASPVQNVAQMLQDMGAPAAANDDVQRAGSVQQALQGPQPLQSSTTVEGDTVQQTQQGSSADLDILSELRTGNQITTQVETAAAARDAEIVGALNRIATSNEAIAGNTANLTGLANLAKTVASIRSQNSGDGPVRVAATGMAASVA